VQTAIPAFWLGEIRLRGRDAVTDARAKLMGLANALDFDNVNATRLAVATSEICRTLTREGIAPRLAVALESHGGRTELVLTCLDDQPLPVLSFSSEFFDRTEQSANGCNVTFRRATPGTPSLDEVFLRRERDRIGRPSRGELLDELRRTNEELERYNTQLEHLVAERTAELQEANRRMRSDLEAGTEYVRSLLPHPCLEPVRIDWRYVPSSSLGGDIFSYHWIDPDHLALYLIDVTGHGLDSALLSVTVTNVVRSGSISGADPRDPGAVLAALNAAFPMERQAGKMFTMWYGVYRPSAAELVWSGGGHPDGLLFVDGSAEPLRLESFGPMLGMTEWPEFDSGQLHVPRGASLFVYSDGAFEIHKADGGEWKFSEFVEFMSRSRGLELSPLDLLLAEARHLKGSDQLDDDFSVFQVDFI
jgi:serine phosphatase RsbU (regulator of sigma subunit)